MHLNSATRLIYRFDGADDRPVIVLSHSLGLDHGMWDAQRRTCCRTSASFARTRAATARRARRQAITRLPSSARDVLAIADACGVQRFAFCGLSLGGMIGQWLAVHAPDRVTHLVLANTTSRLTDPQPMEARRRAVLEGGMAAVEDLVMGRFFSPAVLASGSASVATARRTLLSTNPVGYAGCCAAIRDMDQTGLLSRIKVPTLVISGDLDVGMPWEGHAAVLARSIEGARAVRLPAAHISNLERPRSFTAALLAFLLPAAAEIRAAGFAVRRAVLGDDYVDRAIAGTTDFTRAFQELITSYPWGSIWTRPGLDLPHAPTAGANRHGRTRPPGRNSACTSARVSPTSSNPAIWRKCCCRSPSTPAFRPRMPRFTSPPRLPRSDKPD